MWESVLNTLGNKYVIMGTVLTFLVPFTVSKVNQKLHERGDAPWKKSGRENR